MTRTLLLLFATSMGAASAAPRFDGGGHLRPADAVSADGRFTLEADLKPAAAISANKRFALQAALHADAKSVAAVCGSDDLFRNGFEN
jgi:hypothetical protein